MDYCIYCRWDVVAPGARACEDCADYETAVRVADQILEDCGIESASLAASLGAEIMQEYFLRSVRGRRVRRVSHAEGEPAWPRHRPLS